MIKKVAVIGLAVLMLSGCGVLRKQDPKPDSAQTALTEDLSSLIQDLDRFQTSQDDIDDDALLDN